jgi:hypothetical protein
MAARLTGPSRAAFVSRIDTVRGTSDTEATATEGGIANERITESFEAAPNGRPLLFDLLVGGAGSVCKKYTHDAKISLLLAGLGWNPRGFLPLYAPAPNSDAAH